MATLMVDTYVYSYVTSSNPTRGAPYRPHLEGHAIPVLRVFHDAVVRPVAIGDENVSVGSRHDPGGGPEMIRIISSHSRFAESHEHFSIWVKLADDVPRSYPRLGCRRHCVFCRRVAHPDIALPVHMHPVGPNEHLCAKTLDDVSFGIEFVDRVMWLESSVGIHAVQTKPAAPCGWHRAGFITSDKRPDALPVHVNVH